jgi:hypothetical protein
MRYLGECGTDRRNYPFVWTEKYRRTVYVDESSPYRISKTINKVWYWRCGYSSYRTTLFTIPTKKTDYNFRFPFFSPLHTLKQLQKKYSSDYGFVWLCINKNQFFNYPYWDFKDKAIRFKPLIKIPFQFHVKRMVKFCEKYNKKLFIYAGDSNIKPDQLVDRVNLLKETIGRIG